MKLKTFFTKFVVIGNVIVALLLFLVCLVPELHSFL